jgi:hypothetical protein
MKENYRMLNLLNILNFKWNCMIGYIHDVSARWGIGHTTVWFYDTFTWYLPNKYKLIAGMPYNEYLVRCELSQAEHQINYYAGIASDLILDKLFDMEKEVISDEPILKKEKINE